jgi:energy-coupling factor transport system permease protein
MITTFYTVILTTNFSQIIQGLTRWRVPYPVSFGIGLVFQIIPMVIQEFDSIREAQSSRGLEVEKCSTTAKVKNLVVLAGPLMFRILGKGHFISLAMHYYKLDFGKYRSSFKQTPFGKGDGFFIAMTAASAGIVLFLQYRYVL